MEGDAALLTFTSLAGAPTSYQNQCNTYYIHIVCVLMQAVNSTIRSFFGFLAQNNKQTR